MTFWVAGAVVGSSLIGGVMQSNSASDAADTQAASTQAGIDEQRRQFDLTRSDFAPYREAGTNALGQLRTEMNQPVTSSDVMSDPGYQFGMSQGQLGLDRKAAAAGGRVSGAALKSASEYATNYATTGYNAAYQRRQDRLNRLAALAGIGQSATGSSAAAGGQASGAISNMITSQLAQGNIWGNAANQIGAVAQKWVNTPSVSSGSSAGIPTDAYSRMGYA